MLQQDSVPLEGNTMIQQDGDSYDAKVDQLIDLNCKEDCITMVIGNQLSTIYSQFQAIGWDSSIKVLYKRPNI